MQPTRFDKFNFPEYRFSEYPKAIYAPDGRSYKIANSREEELSLADTVQDVAEKAQIQLQEAQKAVDAAAQNLPTEEPKSFEDTKEDKSKINLGKYENEKAALAQEAWKLGIPIDKRWTMGKIKAKIDEHKALK
jgi:hypothetical protein